MLDFNPYTIIFTVVNLLVLWLFLKKFLFSKINAILDKRAQTVQSELDDAAHSKAQADEALQQYEEQLKSARLESSEIIARAKEQGEKEYQAILDKANAEALAIVEASRRQAEAEQEKMLRESRRKVAQIVFMTAAKLAQKELDAEADMTLVDSFLSEYGDTL